MMRFELGLNKPAPRRALTSALAIAGAYASGGLIPLGPLRDELRGAQAEEGDTGLPGDRPGEEGLPRAGGADQQHARRHGAAEPLVLPGALHV